MSFIPPDPDPESGLTCSRCGRRTFEVRPLPRPDGERYVCIDAQGCRARLKVRKMKRAARPPACEHDWLVVPGSNAIPACDVMVIDGDLFMKWAADHVPQVFACDACGVNLEEDPATVPGER